MQHTMKKTALMVALLAGTAAAQAEWSANVAMTTDYVWRGSSQSDEGPAIQGGFDWGHESGFYAGTWASNVDWDDETPTSDGASVEWDIYAGIGGEFGNGIGWDVGVIRYMYPNSTPDYDWNEIYGSLSYAFNDTVSASFSIAHSSDALATSEDGTYFNVGVDVALPQEFGLSFAVGHYDFDNEPMSFTDYTDYKLALSKSYAGFDFELAYTDTNDDDWFTSGIDGDEYSDSRVFLTVSKSL